MENLPKKLTTGQTELVKLPADNLTNKAGKTWGFRCKREVPEALKGIAYTGEIPAGRKEYCKGSESSSFAHCAKNANAGLNPVSADHAHPPSIRAADLCFLNDVRSIERLPDVVTKALSVIQQILQLQAWRASPPSSLFFSYAKKAHAEA